MTDEKIPTLGGALADRYNIEREIGRGASATVWLAEDIRHSRQVAIKLLKPELAAMLGRLDGVTLHVMGAEVGHLVLDEDRTAAADLIASVAAQAM